MTDEKATLEIEQLRQNIRSLRLQRMLAILGVIGTLIAFVVGNLTDIKAIFYQPPEIKLVFEDAFLKNTGTFHLYDSTAPDKPLKKMAAKELTDWLTLEPGTYTVMLSSGETQVYKRDLVLEDGDREPLIIPAYNAPNIKLVVTNDIPRLAPGNTLKFHIQTSGNGYLWIYELGQDQRYQLLYPGVGSALNQVTVNKAFTLPDSNNYGITAGDQSGEEKLLFVVTSSSRPAQANKIAARMAGLTTKASGGVVTENWGAQTVSYQVGL